MIAGAAVGVSRPGPASRSDLRISDVFLRDGLQAVGQGPAADRFPTAFKLELLEALEDAGVAEIELTGFVHPKVIPILADADELARLAMAVPRRAVIRALVPNYLGAQRALVAGIPKLAALIAASPTYQRLNSNMSVEDGLANIGQIAAAALSGGARVSASIAISFICPYEGIVPEARLLDLVDHLVDLGIEEIWLADSVGLAWPSLVRERIGALLARHPRLTLGLHLHSLAGLALANAFAGMEAGVRSFDGAIGGVGSGIAMPVESLELGNVATEDLNYAFSQSGLETGIDQEAIALLGSRVRALAGGGSSHASRFVSLDRFLEQSRAVLPKLEGARPGARGTERDNLNIGGGGDDRG
ncbi:MAG: beta/alpha barrel domain-containing protein [Candidatus Dormibacteria bacterium]